MSTIKKIPHFKSESAEREFWASHDVTDYFDVRTARRMRFPNLQHKKMKHPVDFLTSQIAKPLKIDATELVHRMRQEMV